VIDRIGGGSFPHDDLKYSSKEEYEKAFMECLEDMHSDFSTPDSRKDASQRLQDLKEHDAYGCWETLCDENGIPNTPPFCIEYPQSKVEMDELALEWSNQLKECNLDSTTYQILVDQLSQLKNEIKDAENAFAVDAAHRVPESLWDTIAQNVDLPSKEEPFYPFYTKPKDEYREEILNAYTAYENVKDFPVATNEFLEALKGIKKEITEAEAGLNLGDRSLWNEICQEFGINPTQF
jgi:hypothetical protein